MAPGIHADSKFEPFSLQLYNNTTLTGLAHIPARTAATPPYIPLIVAIHGGTCTAHNYDIDASHSASLYSEPLGIPFVSINRPSYLATTALDIPEGSNFHLETGRILHEHVLPAVWREYGDKNGCTALVTTCHSMAVPAMIIAASMYAEDGDKKYPLAGIIFSGYGCNFNKERIAQGFFNRVPIENFPPFITYPREVKAELMLSAPSLNLYEKGLEEKLAEQDVPMPREELDSGIRWFQLPETKGKYSERVNVPVLYGLGEHDWLWDGSHEHVKDFEALFKACPRFEGALIGSVPHAIEWAKVGSGWYLRCFGWAAEVTADYAIKAVRI